MCGFFGAVSKNNINKSLIEKSDEYLVCRGPDDHKQLENSLDSTNSISSFHRLSILDLSEKASQPMTSIKYDSSIMFNGEIYNFSQLRNDLENKGLEFSTSNSDTETLLLGFSFYGKDFVNKIDGQFSIAFTDNQTNTLLLIRDRLGQKPLYYSINKDELVYSSNFKSILSYKKNFELDDKQVINFLELGIVPSPFTLDKNISKLEPGEIIEIDLNHISIINKEKYWNLENFVGDNNFDKSIFFELFNNSVKKRLISDVPVAALVSGGLDSTSIIKSLHHTSENIIDTFSVINKNKKYDESEWSNQVVEKYHTNHKSVTIDGNDLKYDPIKVIKSFDEPYADPSIFPSHLIYSHISKNFKVAISGDGGDELLGGYEKIHTSMTRGPLPTRLISFIYRFFPAYLGTGAGLFKYTYSPELSFELLTTDRKLLNLLRLKTQNTFRKSYLNKKSTKLKSFILSDYKFYLSELMMHKVDRTSMDNSLEIRSPFLDHKLIEYVISTNMDFFELKNPKSLLKEFLSGDFDESFLNRQKMGFVFDLESWVYSNGDLIKDILKTSEVLKRKTIKKLFRKKSRINSIRILKLLTLTIFINDYKNISSEKNI